MACGVLKLVSVLRSIKLRNVRCFRDAEILLDPGINVIIGGNGSGKTTLLEALASLAPGNAEGLRVMPVRHEAKSAEVTLTGGVRGRSIAEWTARIPRDGGAVEETRRRLPPDQPVFVYGRYRRVYTEMEEDTGRASKPEEILEQLSLHAAQNCTNTLNVADNNLIRDVSLYLAALHYGRSFDPRFELIWKRLNESLPSLDGALEGIRMEERGNRLIPVILRRGFALEFRELSDGYQALLVIIFDLMLRYPYVFDEIENPLDAAGIVGIDEVDLHLHPKWQRTVVSQLAKLFPNTQFILTTHSPLVVQGAIDSKRAIVRMVEEESEVVPKVLPARLRRELKGAEVGSVLFENKLFGLDSRYSVAYGSVEKEIDSLQDRIRSGQASEADYDSAAKKAATLEELVAKEDARRADGSTMAHMTGLQKALIDDLVRELKSAKR